MADPNNPPAESSAAGAARSKSPISITTNPEASPSADMPPSTLPAISETHTNTVSPTSPTSRRASVTNNNDTTTPTRARGSTNSSATSAVERVRRASLRILEADPPVGMWAATAKATSQAPTIGEIRRGSFSHEGWDSRAVANERRGSLSPEGGAGRRGSRVNSLGSLGGAAAEGGAAAAGRGRRASPGEEVGFAEPFPVLMEETTGELRMSGNLAERRRRRDMLDEEEMDPADDIAPAPPQYDEGKTSEGVVTKEMPLNGSSAEASKENSVNAVAVIEYDDHYVPPPKKPWPEATKIALKAFWKWFLTPSGFLITLYGANVVAWGGMLFLLLCNASPAMCRPTCNDINSPRRKWLEIDSQILNALFCVTGFGLIPWRFRDLYYLLKWRWGKAEESLRILAGINKGWFRLPESDTLDERPILGSVEADPRIPLPVEKAPSPPLTGVRAPPTALWKLDFCIWCNVWNTFLQAVLCGFMWGYNRHTRPSWSTGLFIALACIVAGIAGIVMFLEGKKVKRVEGVPVPVGEETVRDEERNVEIRKKRNHHDLTEK